MTLTTNTSRCKRVLCGLASATIAGASFTAFPVSATGVETYTLSYPETAALFGYTAMGVEGTQVGIVAYDYSDSGVISYSAPNMWYANYNLGGVPYIGIRVYINKEGIAAGRGNWKVDFRLTTYITLENMYDFTLGAGFLTSYTGGEVIGDELWIRYTDNGIVQTETTDFTYPYTLEQITNVETGSRSSGTFVEVSPLTSTLPVYDMYMSVANNPYNFQLKASEPNYNSLAEPYIPENSSPPSEGYFDGYTYIFLRCPTITVDTDALENISAQLGSIIEQITPPENIEPAISSVSAQAGADKQTVSSAIKEEHDFLEDFQYSGFPEGYEPTYSDDAVGFFGILFRFWENNQYAITVSAGAMALALVSYILYGKKF